MTRRHILYLDPYHTASHRSLALRLQERSAHRVTLLTLPPRKWKWRMRGAALAFEPAIRALPRPLPDLIVTTDFTNVPELLALTRDLWPRPVPVILYFHENQLTYPSASADVRDIHFGLVNVHSALAADRVLFNSRFHREEFLSAAGTLLESMPDFRPPGVPERIRARSEVLGLPLDLEEMDAVRAVAKGRDAGGSAAAGGAPRSLVVWNHRWEEDRNPAAFFEALSRLDAMAREGRAPDFAIAVAGQTYRTQPAVFERAREALTGRIEVWGHVESRRDYLALLRRGAVVVSTSHHEFFGVSVMEAVYMGCQPLLPRRLTYPEIACGDARYLYDDDREIPGKAAALLADPAPTRLAPLRERIRTYDAPKIIARWDAIVDELTSR